MDHFSSTHHDSTTHRTFGSSAAVDITATIMVIAVIVLFVVVVFVIGLHLLAKWFWWREQESDPHLHQSGRRRRRFVFVPGQDGVASTLRRGLDPSVLKSIPVLVLRPQDFKDGLECAVCLSEVVQGERARLLPKCNHGFHVDCIDMWFQSHSTCPLCRNPVAAECSSSSEPILEGNVGSLEENSVIGTETSSESPSFPTNVLFWGNETQVSSRTAGTEEGPSSSSHSVRPLPSSAATSSSSGGNGMLVINIPRQMSEGLSSLSPSRARFVEEEGKSPVTTRLRSFKRLLSREKRSNPCSPRPVDVEQAGRGQS